MRAGAFAAARLCVAAADAGLSTAAHRAHRSERDVLRVLAARHALQATVTWLRPRPALIAAGSVLDCVHGLSMITLALADRRYRRPALADATVAAALAAGAIWVDR